MIEKDQKKQASWIFHGGANGFEKAVSTVQRFFFLSLACSLMVKLLELDQFFFPTCLFLKSMVGSTGHVFSHKKHYLSIPKLLLSGKAVIMSSTFLANDDAGPLETKIKHWRVSAQRRHTHRRDTNKPTQCDKCYENAGMRPREKGIIWGQFPRGNNT